MLRKEKIKTLPDQIHDNQHFIVMFHDGGFHDTYSHQKCLSAPVSTHHEGVSSTRLSVPVLEMSLLATSSC